MTPIELSYHQHADDISPHIGRKLGRTNIVEVQNSFDNRVDWEPQTSGENSFIKSYLA